MKVTAKFKVGFVADGYTLSDHVAKQVNLMPDYAEGRNAEWAAATPSGSISLTIDTSKTAAADLFVPGAPITVTFEADEG